MPMTKSLSLLIALLSLLGAAARAQDPIIRVRTNLVQFDVVVTDERGNVITDLRAEDFEVSEKGRTQAAEYSTYIPLTETRQMNSLGEMRLAKNELRRTIAFIVSNPVYDIGASLANRGATFIYSASNRANVSRDAETLGRFLRRFLEEQMGPRDLAAIQSTERDLGILSRFTNDRALLGAAVERIERLPVESPSVSITMTQDAIGQEIIKQNISVLEMLGSTIEQVKTLPGRKLIVLVSRGLFLSPQFPEAKTIRNRLRELTVQANRAQIAVYTLNPRSLGQRGGTLQDQDSLNLLAHETGGEAIYNTNDLSVGFGEILRENAGYYLLAYDPGDEVEKAPHEIKVRVKRPGLRVRARTVVYRKEGADGPPPESTIEASSENSGVSLDEAINTPFARREVGLNLKAIFVSPDGERTRLMGEVTIDPTRLTWESQADGGQQAKFELAYRVINPHGKPLITEAKKYTLTLTAADYSRVKRDGLPYGFNLDLVEPGFHQFEAAIRDEASGRVGNASRFVRVPALASRDLAASTLILSTPPAAESSATNLSPAGLLRQRFMSGETLRYRVYVYHAQLDIQQTPQLLVQAKIIANSKIIASTPLRLATTSTGKIAPIAGDIPLADFAPGLYRLEVTITDRLQKDARLVTSSDFEIR